MNEPGEGSPLHSEGATASAADRPVAGIQSMIALASSRILERGAAVLEGFDDNSPRSPFSPSRPPSGPRQELQMTTHLKVMSYSATIPT